MGDFITRLAERTLGVEPVVQPLIASMFAPGPTGHSLDLEWDSSEATTMSGDLDRARVSSAREETPPPARSTPTGRPEDAAIAQQEDRSDVAPTTPKRTQRTPDTRPDPHRPAESRPSEPRIASGQEDQRNSSSATPASPQGTPKSWPEPLHLSRSGSSERRAVFKKEDQEDSSRATTRHPRVPPETRPETLHRAEPDSTHRDPSSKSQRVSPENASFGLPSTDDGSGQAAFRPIRTLVDHVQGATLPPSPGIRASVGMKGDILEPEVALDRSASPAAAPPVAPRIVRPRLDTHVERGSQEPHVALPESSAPNIQVAIGRIEVRAITPPPMPPAQQATPTRPSPALSLDDYLKQRNGGQR